MKLFVDANILISVLNKEYPLFTTSSRILSLSGYKRYRIFTSPVCLAIAFYFAEKKHSTAVAKSKMQVLSRQIDIAVTSANAVRKALDNPKVHDFEDGLEYYAALESKCDCIITENLKDFYFSEIEVLDCQGFAKKYLIQI